MLRDAERAALAAYAEAWRTRRHPCGQTIDPDPVLARLVTPLEDVAARWIAEGAPEVRHQRRRFLRALLEAVHQRGTPYWAWTAEEWRALARRGALRDAYGIGGTGVVAAAYLLGGVVLASSPHGRRGRAEHDLVGRIVFGPAFREALARVECALASIGYAQGRASVCARAAAVYAVAAYAGSPDPADWRPAHLLALHGDPTIRRDIRQRARGVGEALRLLGYLSELPRLGRVRASGASASNRPPAGVAAAWWRMVRRWSDTSPLEPKTRRGYVGVLLKVGRWLARHHPEVTTPDALSREIAVELVGDICNRWTAGAYAVGPAHGGRDRGAPQGGAGPGRPLSPASIVSTMAALRTVLGDYVAWEWGTLRVTPARVFVAPRAITQQVGPNPRDIDATLYARLLYGALTLAEADLPRPVKYPLAMVQAAAVLWTQAGLRANELGRLTVGCVRWEPLDKTAPDGEVLRAGAMAFLTVPDNKTSRTFVKAVAPAVGHAVEAWEAERGAGHRPRLDAKSRREVDYLFLHRGDRLGTAYLNHTLIPLLCRKMGLPTMDAKGRITSHRARATMATLLLNAPDGMTLTELAAWLGHRTPDSTTYYAQITPLRQAQAVARASRALVEVDVILDLDRLEQLAAARAGADTGEGGRWAAGVLKYDLGHGYCHHKFFSQCPHRMACARCQHYEPKPASAPGLVELQRNHLRLTQAITLRREERAALEGDDVAVAALLARLHDTPTPSGETPRALEVARRSSP